jgi:hypothetical protein
MREKPGIAANEALMENLFSMIVCISNKIPLIICGKPGCSKSLSLQLIIEAMRGSNSPDPFFRSLPKIFMVHIFGSTSTTSKQVINVFQKARSILEKAQLSTQ